MPVAMLASGSVGSTTSFGARRLIPGIEPGGSRVGQPMKPALFINDVWARFVELTDSGTTADFDRARVALQLGQEQSMDPSLLLYVAEAVLAKTATANLWNGIDVNQMFHAQGTIWAPEWVSGRAVLEGATAMNVDLFIDYEMVMIPWVEWFVKWEFLDNVVNGRQEY